MEWETTQQGLLQPSGSGWSISNRGLAIRFSLEAALGGGCDGSNDNVQSGTANAIIDFGQASSVSFNLSGIGSDQFLGQEVLEVFLNGVRIGLADWAGETLTDPNECFTAPLKIRELTPQPVLLPIGEANISVTFSTINGQKHSSFSFGQLGLVITC